MRGAEHRRQTPPVRQRCGGAALMLVLWLIALLAALIGAFAVSARIEYMQARVLGRGVVAEQAARAGLEYAMTRVADNDPSVRWLADGRPYHWHYADADVSVKIFDESGKIDLNGADMPLLTALLRAAGAEQAQADALAAAIVDWRDSDDAGQVQGGAEDAQYAAAGLPYGAKDAPFESVAELELVLGMPTGLYERLRPDLTVHTGLAIPDLRFATAGVLTAMGADAAQVLATRERPPDPDEFAQLGAGSGTYSIECLARLPDGREGRLRAVVRSGASGVPGSAFTVLRWEEGASPR